MTIDELLEQAVVYAGLSVTSPAGTEARAMFAQIAQACAQTAQAMILAQTTASIANGQARILMVDTNF